MYLLYLCQDEDVVELGLFDSEEEARGFAKTLPGYKYEEDPDLEGYFYETLDYKALPEYIEVNHKGHLIPLSKFTFEEAEPIDIYYKELVYLSHEGNGLVPGFTAVDAYVVENSELKSYIAKREENYKETKLYLEGLGYQVSRSFQGSEDGEAIIYKREDEDQWHFLTHMDPNFVNEYTEEDIKFDLGLGD